MSTALRIPSPVALPRSSRRLAWLGLAAVLALTAGCGRSEANGSKGGGQVVAKVNKQEISVHQVNYVLQRTPGVTSANADAVSRQVLDRLVSQELAVQQAQELKLDRSPGVVQALEAARREVLARAYIEKLGEGVAKPTAAEVSDFYAKRPALFRQRKIYTVQELTFQATEAEIAQVRERASSMRSAAELANWARGSGLRHGISQATVAAENVPLESLDRLASMSDGQSVTSAVPGGIKVTTLIRSELAAVEEAAARTAIEQYILNDRRRQKVEADMKALRANAQVELMGKFAQSPAAGGAAPAAPVATAPAPASASAAAGSLTDDALKKGLGIR